jgi:hypothetical protein
MSKFGSRGFTLRFQRLVQRVKAINNPAAFTTVCFIDLCRLNLRMMIPFLSSSQFLPLPQLPQKNEVRFKSGQKRLKIIGSLTMI